MAAPELTDPLRPPSQLPLDLADFSGRQEHLEQLRDLVCGRDPVRPPIAVISGAPGTGKTSLAVRLGHLVREHFPDGQIYLDMHGATHPRDPAAALTDLLLSLNLPDYAIPTDPERRSAMLRSELASRRVLIILDDVATAGQVTPLMPGTGASAVVVTSRNRLMDLAGADSTPLDTFDDQEAALLLSSVAGAGRIDPSSPEAEEILTACANLPLAIRIVGSRLAQRPDLSARELARRLRDESARGPGRGSSGRGSSCRGSPCPRGHARSTSRRGTGRGRAAGGGFGGAELGNIEGPSGLACRWRRGSPPPCHISQQFPTCSCRQGAGTGLPAAYTVKPCLKAARSRHFEEGRRSSGSHEHQPRDHHGEPHP
jgi:hypothetical protein